MEIKITILSILLIVFIIMSAVGFYEYFITSENYSSLQQSYSNLSSSYELLQNKLNNLNKTISSLNSTLSTPMFKVIDEQTVTVSSSQGAIIRVGPITTIVTPGTYAELSSDNILSMYNFSLILLNVKSVPPPPGYYNNLTPAYAFAFAINGQITPSYSLVNSNKTPNPTITIVQAPDTWTSWTWFGGTFNGTVYTGGTYKFPNKWIYGNNLMVNTQFYKPVIWILEASSYPQGISPTPSNVVTSTAYGLTPINIYSVSINSQYGGVIVAGNIITIVQPGTIINTPTRKINNYNFSIVFYNPLNVTPPSADQTPFLAFAYAIDGNVTFSYTASKPFITIILTPSQNAEMWTWGSKSGRYTYLFKDPILIGNGIVINLTFVKPVPWILTLPTSTMKTTSRGNYY